MTIRSVIKGSGSALPKRAVPNAEMAVMVDTTDEWIVERTGIRNRYIAGEGETTATLAIEAARNALQAAGIDAADIGLIVLATATPDQTFPATATQVQHALGCNGGIAFDVAAVCSGFLYALSVADAMLKTWVAVAGKVWSGVAVASTIRPTSAASIPAAASALRAASVASVPVVSPSPAM